jgi:hypothetical protein
MLSLRFTPLCHLLFHAYTSDARNAFPVVGVVTNHLILY